MSRPPRPPRSRLLDQASLRFIIVSGTLKASGGLAVLAFLPILSFSLDETRTALFLYESVLQLVFAYPSRRVASKPLANPWLHVAVFFGIGLQVLTIVLPPLRALLVLAPLTLSVLAAVMGAALLTWAIAELWARSGDEATVQAP